MNILIDVGGRPAAMTAADTPGPKFFDICELKIAVTVTRTLATEIEDLWGELTNC